MASHLQSIGHTKQEEENVTKQLAQTQFELQALEQKLNMASHFKGHIKQNLKPFVNRTLGDVDAAGHIPKTFKIDNPQAVLTPELLEDIAEFTLRVELAMAAEKREKVVELREVLVKYKDALQFLLKNYHGPHSTANASTENPVKEKEASSSHIGQPEPSEDSETLFERVGPFVDENDFGHRISLFVHKDVFGIVETQNDILIPCFGILKHLISQIDLRDRSFRFGDAVPAKFVWEGSRDYDKTAINGILEKLARVFDLPVIR